MVLEKQKLRRGHVRDDGMVFIGYHAYCKNGERWGTQAQLDDMRKRATESARRNYPKHRDKILARTKAAYRKDPARAAAINRNSRYKREFGITTDDYNAMLGSQGGVCAICRKPHPGSRTFRAPNLLCVDHDHETGAVRGLLCTNCNAGIGMLKDDTDTVASALQYLRTHKAKKCAAAPNNDVTS